jgi:hypothetical protein
MGTGCLFQGYSSQGVTLTTHPLLEPRLSMGGAKTPPPLCDCWICYGTAFTFHKGTYALSVTFFLLLLFADIKNLLLDYIHSLVLKNTISYLTHEVKPQSSGPDAICINLAHKSNVVWFLLVHVMSTRDW